MSKRIEQNGRFYRMPRGKLVEIPAEWLGVIPTLQTIRQRPSKIAGGLKRIVKDAGSSRFKDRRDHLKQSMEDM